MMKSGFRVTLHFVEYGKGFCVMKRSETAVNLFLKGANCSQAVFASFGDITGFDEKTSFRLASSFGGGISRLRETCGACLGMCLAAGAIFGYDDINDRKAKIPTFIPTAIAGLIFACIPMLLSREDFTSSLSVPFIDLGDGKTYAYMLIAGMLVFIVGEILMLVLGKKLCPQLEPLECLEILTCKSTDVHKVLGLGSAKLFS